MVLSARANGLAGTRGKGEERILDAMTASAADWQLDRLSPEARAAADRAAAREGMSLSDWLARVITHAAAAQGITLPAEPRRETAALETAAPPASETPAPAAPLVADAQVTDPALAPAAAPESGSGETQLSLNFEGTVVSLPVSALVPGSCGTRRADDEIPAALIAAVAIEGVRQPLLIRPRPGEAPQYEIIAGKRRWQAALRAGMAEVPAIISDLDDAQAVLSSLRENLRRDDLTPMEEARAYLRLLTRHSLNVNDINRATGRHRHYIVQTLRLLGLSAPVRAVLETHQLAMGHALLLLETAEPEALANAILRDGLSVEETRRRLELSSSLESPP